jgi:hypothetical protein
MQRDPLLWSNKEKRVRLSVGLILSGMEFPASVHP